MKSFRRTWFESRSGLFLLQNFYTRFFSGPNFEQLVSYQGIIHIILVDSLLTMPEGKMFNQHSTYLQKCILFYICKPSRAFMLFTPRAESPEGYYYHGCGRACAMSVVSRFFIQFFSYDPEISHACSPP